LHKKEENRIFSKEVSITPLPNPDKDIIRKGKVLQVNISLLLYLKKIPFLFKG
jgi:hypothetical protein